jgi:hypothetical protein
MEHSQRIGAELVGLHLIHFGTVAAQLARFQVHIGDVQPHNFAYAQPVVEQQAHRQHVTPPPTGTAPQPVYKSPVVWVMVVIILALLGLLVLTMRPSESSKKGTPVAQVSATLTLSHEQMLMITATAISQELTAAAAERLTLTPATPQPIVILSSDTPSATETASTTPTATAIAAPSPTELPTATNTHTEVPTQTPQIIVILPSETPTVTETDTPTLTETASVTPSPTETATPLLRRLLRRSPLRRR